MKKLPALAKLQMEQETINCKGESLLRILIIEDETELREDLEDGELGWEMLMINQYDLLLLDLNLPYIDDMDILKRVRTTDSQFKNPHSFCEVFVGENRQIHQVNNDRFDLSELLQEIEDNYLVLAREKNITLVCESPSVFVFADRLLFGQMLSNFIENAIKYNHPSGSVTVSVSTKEKALRISVQDTGIGIPDDKKLFLFEPFYRIEQSRNKLYKGIDLAFAKEIIQLYRGEVCIKDIEPTGSIFILTFSSISVVGRGMPMT